MAIALETDFPGGNGALLGVDGSADPPAVRFAAEPKNCPMALWFHFRLRGPGDRGVRAVLANPEQTLGGPDWSGNRPVARAGGEWARLGPAERVEAPGGRVEWGWDLPPGDAVEMAHCFPYQPEDLRATLDELGGAFGAATIGVSLAARPLPRVFSGLPAPGRPAVYLTARHHAGETPGSWVLDGLLRHVAADERLREAATWWATPFVNLDDVVGGSYGKDPWPHDCNRGYGRPGPCRPESLAVVRDATRLKDAAGRMLFIDVHAPGHAERANYVPTRGWDEDSPDNPVAEAFAAAFQAACPEDIRSREKTTATPKPGPVIYRGMSSRAWAQEVLGVDAISLEISYQGNGRTYYTIDDYRRLGAALATTAADHVLAAGGPSA